MRTLHDLSDLRESRFGQPSPRHGLNLLWWFAHECVQIDSNGRMIARCDPENGDFGFCLFHNRERLLPYSNLPYYEVGNLNTTDSLPEYVTEDYTGYLDDSNTDRIIVLFNSRWNRFDSVYVTQHSDPVKFDWNHTYCINPLTRTITPLMKHIRRSRRKEFLRKTLNDSCQITIEEHSRHSQFPSAAQSVKSELNQSESSHSSTEDDSCSKCCKRLMMLLFIFAVLFLLLKLKI
ncbi:hypothetical protein ABG768_001038 [Culter alburnus]|uniref:Uncharacterized protein n=1 Tax=Culter alburnus TaxID=194366 RepID=A0AAW2B946_CULAL